MGCVHSLCFEFFFTIVTSIYFFLSCLKKQKREPIQQGIRRTFCRSEKIALCVSSRLPKSSLSSLLGKKRGQWPHPHPHPQDPLLASTDSPTRGRSQKSLHQMFRTCFSRAKMRGRELGIFYVIDLTNYFASESSSRPLQSLVSSLKERESAQ